MAGIIFEKKGAVSVIFPSLIFLVLLRIALIKVKFYKFYMWIYTFLIFLLILALLLSSDFLSSIKEIVKISMTFLIFIISFQIIRKISAFIKLQKKILFLMLFYLLNFFIMNFLGISLLGYSDGEDVATGNIFSEGLNSMTYCLVILPVILLFFPQKKWVLIFFGILVYITMIVTLKRTSIAAVAVGYIFFLIFLEHKGKLVKGIIVCLIVGVAFFPLYSEILYKQIENRSSRFEEGALEKEGRYRETIDVFSEVFSFEDPVYSFFGKEIFNSPGTYGDKSVWGERMLHADYNVLIHGSGIVGLVWYIMIQFLILQLYKKYRKRVYSICGYNIKLDYINAAFLSVFYLTFVISLSGAVYQVVVNSVRYLFLGGVLGLFYAISSRGVNIFLEENEE